MASLFWVNGTGNWDGVDVTHWATSSGGSTHPASAPGSGDTATFDASSGGGTVTVTTNFTVTSVTMGAFTGTLDFGTSSPTMATFNCSGTGTRTLTMTNMGTMTLTGNGTTIYTTSTATNLTLNPGGTINCTYSGATGTRTLSTSTAAINNLTVSAGTDIVALSTTFLCNSLDFTGFTGSLTSTGVSLTGNLTFGTGMTVTAGTNTFTFLATSGTQVLRSNSVVCDRNVTLNGAGGTVQLFDDFNMASPSVRTLQINFGTFDANGKNLSVGLFSSSNTNTRAIKMGNGTWTITNSGSAWNANTGSLFTITPAGSTIKFTDSTNTAITFAGGTGANRVYNNIYWNRGASTATNTITGTNTFADFKDDGTAAHSIVFPNVTTTVTSFTVSGTAGQLITLARTGGSGTFTVSDTSGTNSCDYLSISNSTATGGALWFAGAHSTDGGSNTGWFFYAPPASSGGMLSLL